eukprot:TRINITY_DN53143_c0_g1_i1.p1 TRINITY_DN53143_c0_g1~~TRINITY_DN53143_c0_g1_i1.p1  ORF type:complete len:106 (-),score=8.89 TRINITY_DN53143_c0_g1_i1:4-321(-)
MVLPLIGHTMGHIHHPSFSSTHLSPAFKINSLGYFSSREGSSQAWRHSAQTIKTPLICCGKKVQTTERSKFFFNPYNFVVDASVNDEERDMRRRWIITLGLGNMP